jgi:Protein of unknown function (DUF2523)
MNWASFLMGLATPIARRVVIALGLGVVTYTGVDLAVSGLLSQAKSAWSGGLTGSVAQLVAMAGVNTALGIICGGIVGRVTMLTLKRMQVL